MYSTVPDKAAGDVFTEAMWDTFIKDNMNKGLCRPIAETTLSGSVGTITFSSIAADWTHLLLLHNLRGDTGLAQNLLARFNADSGTNYNSSSLAETGTASTHSESIAGSSMVVGAIGGTTAPANSAGAGAVFILNYATTTFWKQLVGISTESQGIVTATTFTRLFGGHWKNAAALSSITLLPASGNFITGGKATLYGLGGV